MAEFKFSCPQCKQSIQCDSVYAGSQINCPSCQQAIVVPPVPPSVAAPGERTFQIKMSTVKKAALIGLCVLLAAGIVEGAFYLIAGPRTVTFKAYIDGTDVLKLRGKRLWIEHLTWQQPNKISINGKKWEPAWNSDKSPSFPGWNGNATAPYPMAANFSSVNPAKIKLTKRLGRGEISIMELPMPSNRQTLAIKIDDGPQPGADWYEFTVSW